MKQTIRYLLPIAIPYILNCQALSLNCTDGSSDLTDQCNSPTLTNAAHFICGSDESCKEKTIECSNNQHCIVECNGEYACESSIIHCPDNYDCTIRCITFHSCYEAIIHAEQASNLSIWTIPEQFENNLSYIIEYRSTPNALRSTQIYCPWQADCYINVIGYLAGHGNNKIHAQNTSNLYVYAGIVIYFIFNR